MVMVETSMGITSTHRLLLRIRETLPTTNPIRHTSTPYGPKWSQ